MENLEKSLKKLEKIHAIMSSLASPLIELLDREKECV